jgi:dienelactone hydrolase
VVLTPHGHGKAGKATYAGIADDEESRRQIDEGERDIAVQAAAAGYVAIAMDMRGFASLRMQREREQDAISSCRTLSLHALLFGRTLIGERVHDMMRLIDWAATRDDCDTSRVAITGNSGGGTISLFAAACDERIAVSVPGCYFCTFAASIGSIHHCECNYVPGLLAEAEMPDVAGLIAPRPFLAVAGRHDDIFPVAAVESAYQRLRFIYALAGAADRCHLSIGDGGHRYYKKDVWPFMREYLGE